MAGELHISEQTKKAIGSVSNDLLKIAGVSELLVITQADFDRFLNKYLPTYLSSPSTESEKALLELARNDRIYLQVPDTSAYLSMLFREKKVEIFKAFIEQDYPGFPLGQFISPEDMDVEMLHLFNTTSQNLANANSYLSLEDGNSVFGVLVGHNFEHGTPLEYLERTTGIIEFDNSPVTKDQLSYWLHAHEAGHINQRHSLVNEPVEQKNSQEYKAKLLRGFDKEKHAETIAFNEYLKAAKIYPEISSESAITINEMRVLGLLAGSGGLNYSTVQFQLVFKQDAFEQHASTGTAVSIEGKSNEEKVISNSFNNESDVLRIGTAYLHINSVVSAFLAETVIEDNIFKGKLDIDDEEYLSQLADWDSTYLSVPGNNYKIRKDGYFPSINDGSEVGRMAPILRYQALKSIYDAGYFKSREKGVVLPEQILIDKYLLVYEKHVLPLYQQAYEDVRLAKQNGGVDTVREDKIKMANDYQAYLVFKDETSDLKKASKKFEKILNEIDPIEVSKTGVGPQSLLEVTKF